MANICFFDDDFYEIYENEEDCPLKKGYLLVKGKYLLFSVDTFPDEIISLSDIELKNIFYPNYSGNNIFDKYYPPNQFNNFSVFGVGHAFGKTDIFKNIDKFYVLIFHPKNSIIFYDNKNKKNASFEYNKIYKAFFFFNTPKKHIKISTIFLLLLSFIFLFFTLKKHSLIYFFITLLTLYIIYIKKLCIGILPQLRINKILKIKHPNYKFSSKK